MPIQENLDSQEPQKHATLSKFKTIPKHVFFLIAIAMIMTSFASILIRLAGRDVTTFWPGIEPADASVIAFWRLLFATGGMFLGAVLTRNLKQLKKVDFKKDMPLLVLAGFMLAVHFISWNQSLQMTTVASSITIVYLMPLFTLIFSIFFLKERASWMQTIAIFFSISGAIIVGIADLVLQESTGGATTLIGDLLALLGGISGAAYFVIGRKKREKLDIFSYTTVVYGICTLFILTYLLGYNGLSMIPSLTLEPLTLAKLNWQHYLFFFLLALGPSCLGHTLYNYSLGYVRAPVITVTALGEMFGSTLLAFAIFNETPTHWSAYIGMFLVALGIIATVIIENRTQKEQKNS
ncbi:MAG: DMT family transporter [Candidatus Heimdallarchaeota archaeon]|nr:DMT family transporter [Candidatus Heimdallarchaeota archaeon]